MQSNRVVNKNHTHLGSKTYELENTAQPHTQVPNIYAEKYLQVPPAPSLLCKRMEVRMLFSETLRPEIFVLYGTVWGNLSQ